MVNDEFYYHRVTPEIALDMTDFREMYINVAEVLDEHLPDGRAKSLALTYLEESLMRAIQSLALTGEKVPKGTVA